jgi:archaellum component FlaC
MTSSIAIGGFSMCILIDGETLEFHNLADIENLSRERAVQIIKHLLFVERPALLLEASKVPNLQQNIKKLTDEKDFFFKKAQIIEDLSAKIVQYHNENELLEKDIAKLTKQYHEVSEKYNEVSEKYHEVSEKYHEVSEKLTAVTARLDEVIQPISARQMATNADNAAINAIFPLCRKKPYCLRSYRNLLSFLSNPQSDDYTGPLAPKSWLELEEIERTAIKSKAEKFAACNPYLKVSIKMLKEEAWEQAHSTTTVEETLNFYKEDEGICEAVKVCAAFLASMSDEATEIDE